jgi:hypothetical protein
VEIIIENSNVSDKRKLKEYKEFIPAQLVIRESCGKRK